MRHPLPLLTLTLSALCSHGEAGAESETRQLTLYRCGVDGRDLRETPCPAGPSASQTLVYPQPSAAQSQEAAQRARREAALAEQLARERTLNEAAQARALREAPGALVMGSVPPSPAASTSSRTAKPQVHRSRVAQARRVQVASSASSSPQANAR